MAAVLPDPAGREGAAPDDADEADGPVRQRGGGAGVNEALLARAAGKELLRTERLWRIAATGRRIQAAGGATRTRVRDRSRAAGRRAHAIAVKLSSRAAQAREEKQAAVARATGSSGAWPNALPRGHGDC